MGTALWRIGPIAEQRLYPRSAKLALRAIEFMSDLRDNVTEIVIEGLEVVAVRTHAHLRATMSTAVASWKPISATRRRNASPRRCRSG